jgi:ferredoxin
MTKRKIITFNESLCTGCGQCIPNCPEGAIQVIDGKARLISDIFCDGLGACIGHCPEGAITIEERDAGTYDERKVMDNIIKAGPNTIKAHLDHLKAHGETKYLSEALQVLKEKGITLKDEPTTKPQHHHCQCPGSTTMDFSNTPHNEPAGPQQASQLRQWPIQLHLISPEAPYYRNRDVLLTADCVAYALGSYHTQFLRGKSIAIACPKLDTDTDVYVDKIHRLIDEANIKSLTIMVMEVPCCRGLVQIVEEARQRSKKKIPLKVIVVGIQGDIRKEEHLS